MISIYHITTAAEVEMALHHGEYVPKAFDTDGFIHCSYRHQVIEVANVRFRGCKDLVLLQIDPTKAHCKVVDENLEGGDQLFPHLYGHLPISAIEAIHQFPCGDDGLFAFRER